MMKTLILTITIGTLFLSPVDLNSQIPMENTELVSRTLVGEGHITDSTVFAESQKLEKRNEERMADAKNERNKTQAKARQSQRVSNEADDAAKQSRQALRAEKRAQKSREKADRQAQKAEDARNKSDEND